MLKKIEITNFKNFKDKFIFDLSDTNNFEFNQDCIQNGIVNTGLIYGHNGCGKSNLGLAIFDLLAHLTDKKFEDKKYNNYLNANNYEKKAIFKFTFLFEESIVEYKYSKSDVHTLISEELIIDNKSFLSINREKSSIFTITANGTENLIKDVGESKISIISFIANNTLLEENTTNNLFKKFRKFITEMLFFKTLDEKLYMGYEQGGHSVQHDIVSKGNLEKFQNFLFNAGINCNLISKEIDEQYKIFDKFDNKEIPFFNIASSGTKMLSFFYFFYQRLKKENAPSFMFIDEFDAFYHHDLSTFIIKKLRDITSTQIILTTHNTTNISNDLLRPDCYFIMDDKKITSLKERTNKELREAHNIEKMFRAGSFE